jgi:integration host factor subunit beta
MNKSELIQNLQKQFSYMQQADVKEATQTILDAISESIATIGHKVEIRGFGSFSARIRPPRQIRNPKTGEKLHATAKAVPFFKAGLGLREKVNFKPVPVDD